MLQTNFNFRHPKPRRAQGGLALIFVLIMMTIVFSIVTITARIATQGDRAARNDRDRQVAFNAAEAAVNEALEDISSSKKKTPFPVTVSATTKPKIAGSADQIPRAYWPIPSRCMPISPSSIGTMPLQTGNTLFTGNSQREQATLATVWAAYRPSCHDTLFNLQRCRLA